MLVEVVKLNKKDVNVVSSLDVAETFEKRHDHVMRDIETLLKSIPKNGETYFYKEEYINEQNKQTYPMYLMNRDGFTLLVMGYTGEKAMKFKLAYIKQFNAMEDLLQGKLVEREKGIAVRQSLTKAIQVSNENERMHGHAYSTYTDVIYKSIFGKTAKQLREKYDISKGDNLRDCFSQEELAKIQNAEMLVSSLIAYGWGYNEIKDFVNTQASRLIAA